MTVGIIGGGQLGRMMALAGYPLGLDFLFLDRSNDTPAAAVAPTLVGEFTDRRLLRELARRSEVLTFDWENISLESVQALGRRTRVAPPLAALAMSQDRISEKKLFEKLGIPTTRYAAVDSAAALTRALRRVGLPGVLKTRRLGYDGKGQAVVRSAEEAAAAWSRLGGVPLIYEEFVPFDYEVSIIGARSRHGEVAIYPLNPPRRCNAPLRGICGVCSNTSATRVCSTSNSSCIGVGCSPTRPRRACTTQDTGPSRVRQPASSRTTCAPSSVCRSARRARVATRR